ncbi:MAG: terminase small subunit [Psychrobium sp.]|nr:terminase small subunit [Psychrobium sp.]
MSATKTNSKIEPFWLNKSQMAASAGLTVQCFDRWGVEPTARVGRSAYFLVSDVIQNRLNREIEKQHPKKMSLDQLDPQQVTYEKYRLTKAQADAQELKNELAQGHVVPTDFATFALTRVAAEAVGILDGLVISIKHKYPELTVLQLESIRRELAKASNLLAALGDMVPNFVEEYIAETTE